MRTGGGWRNGAVAAALLAATLAAGCGGSSGNPSGGPPEPTFTPPSPGPVPSSTNPPAGDPAPAALRGTWQQVYNPRTTFVLVGHRYEVHSFGDVAGRVEFLGNRFAVWQASACSGTGYYRWSLKGARLHVTAIGADACPGRSAALAGQTFTKE